MITMLLSPSTPVTRSASRFAQLVAQAAAPGTDQVQLSGLQVGRQAPPAPRLTRVDLPETGSHTGTRLLAGLGLVGVALSLAGCGGGGTATTPANPTAPQQQEAHAANLTQRLDQLRTGKDQKAYLSMAQATYYHHVLDLISKETDSTAKPDVDLANKGLAAFDFNGDPGTQLSNQREVLQAIAQGQKADGVLGRYQDVAKAALEIGDALGQNGAAALGNGGIVAQLKASGYEQALQQVVQKLPTIPDQVHQQTGVDIALIRNYTSGLQTTTQASLDAGKEINDTSLQSLLYENTVTQVYNRVKADGNVLGTQFQQILDLAMQLKSRLGG